MKDNNALIWLWNGIVALAISGLYSIILVVLRTPQLSRFFLDQSMFKSALVIHVNLSVLVWLLAITCSIWSYSKVRTGFESSLAHVAFTGILLMAFSPLYSESEHIMNNYIPMLENIFFIIGLSLFGVIVLGFAIQTVFTSFTQCDLSDYGERIIAITKFTSAFMFICVWLCFVLSFFSVDALSRLVPLDIDFYYEMLFWSGGHLLQFIYTQILMLVLLVLAESWRGGRVSYFAVYEILLALNFILSLFVFGGHYQYDMSDDSFKEFYTLHMLYTGGIIPTIFIATLLLEIIQKRISDIPQFVPIAFMSAILLFLFGSMIEVVISGANVIIPAYYHGSIFGISTAFMGLSYMFCFQGNIYQKINKLRGVISYLFSKGKRIKSEKISQNAASWQIFILTVGQFLHITGLVLASSYGVLKKTPADDITLSTKIYMGMVVGGGGLIAMIGGLMFVYVCARNLYSQQIEQV